MVGPDRRPVPDPLDIMPHTVAVDEMAAGLFGDAQHPSIDMVRHAGDHSLRRRAEPHRPVCPHQVMIGADAAGGHDDDRGVQLEVAGDGAGALVAALDVAGFEHGAAHARDRAAAGDDLIDAMPETEGEPARLLGLAAAGHERLQHARSRAPGDVEARHGIAVTRRVGAAALRPADHWKEFYATRREPRPFFAGSEIDIGFGPFPRPGIFRPVEGGRAQPVGQRQFVRVTDAHTPLLGRIDQEEPAERPERLSAQRLFRLLVEDDGLASGIDKLAGSDQAGQTGTDDDGVGVPAHVETASFGRNFPPPLRGEGKLPHIKSPSPLRRGVRRGDIFRPRRMSVEWTRLSPSHPSRRHGRSHRSSSG